MQRKKQMGHSNVLYYKRWNYVKEHLLELCKRTPLSKSTMIDNEKFIFLSILLHILNRKLTH
jgi:hypothetical protein